MQLPRYTLTTSIAAYESIAETRQDNESDLN
jgi:hypothetical protein